MDDGIKIITDDEIDTRALFQVFRKRSKLIVLTVIISLGIIVSYRLYKPKIYESNSIISIGKIFGIQIISPKDLTTALELIEVPGYTDLYSYSKDKLEYDYRSLTILKITAISKDPDIAFTLNQAILDTILNRHNDIINKAIKPIELAIKNITSQIEYYEDLNKIKNKVDTIFSTFLAQLTASQTALIMEKNKVVPTTVVILPQIPTDPKRSAPLLLYITLALIIGLLVGCTLAIIREEAYNRTNSH